MDKFIDGFAGMMSVSHNQAIFDLWVIVSFFITWLGLGTKKTKD
jgi:hypothetical protein